MLLPAGVRRVRFDRMLGRCASASLFSTRRNPKSLLFFEPILKSFCDHLGNEAVENLVEKMQCGPGTGDENYILAVAGVKVMAHAFLLETRGNANMVQNASSSTCVGMVNRAQRKSS